jgi:hypothetical protein
MFVTPQVVVAEMSIQHLVQSVLVVIAAALRSVVQVQREIPQQVLELQTLVLVVAVQVFKIILGMELQVPVEVVL